eukprot:scaffold170578_cov15-Tisochrysis_lutea.AAC.1
MKQMQASSCTSWAFSCTKLDPCKPRSQPRILQNEADAKHCHAQVGHLVAVLQSTHAIHGCSQGHCKSQNRHESHTTIPTLIHKHPCNMHSRHCTPSVGAEGQSVCAGSVAWHGVESLAGLRKLLPLLRQD